MPAIDIDIRIQRTGQLFDSLDPAPFREKSLDRDFEAYLRDCMAEHPPHVVRRLVIHAPPSLHAHARDIEQALHAHFRFQLEQAQRRARGHRRQQTGVVLLGGVVLVVALLLRQLLEAVAGTATAILSEGLLVLGWVALWRPIETLLFERRQRREEQIQLQQLAAMEIVWRAREEDRIL